MWFSRQLVTNCDSVNVQELPAHEVTARQAGPNAGFARNPSIFNLNSSFFNDFGRQVGSPGLESSDDSLAEQWGQNDIHCVRLSYCSAPIVLPDFFFPFPK